MSEIQDCLIDLVATMEMWDVRYSLPVIPEYQNPMLYTAYCASILMHNKASHPIDENYEIQLQNNFIAYFTNCCTYDGHIWRYPEKDRGDVISHDELIGAAYMSKITAVETCCSIEENCGYMNQYFPRPKSVKEFFRWNMYRFPWAIAYIKEQAGKGNFLWRTIYGLNLLWDAYISKDQGSSGRLLLRLMNKTMKKHCPRTFNLWKNRMTKRGITPKTLFAEYFPKYPWFEKWAESEF